MKLLFLLIFIITGLFYTACPTIGKFNHLQSRVDNLEKEKKILQEKQSEERQRVEKFFSIVKTMEEELKKQDANTSSDLETLSIKVAQLKGGIDEISYNLTRIREEIETLKKFLDEKLGYSPVTMPAGFSEDRKTLISLGSKSFENGDYGSSRGFFRRYIEKFPNDVESAHVQFSIGETYFMEGKYSYAMREYQKVHDNYKNFKNAPVEKALMRIVDCLLKMNECKKAEAVLKYIINYNKKAPEAEKAKELLKKLKEECK